MQCGANVIRWSRTTPKFNEEWSLDFIKMISLVAVFYQRLTPNLHPRELMFRGAGEHSQHFLPIVRHAMTLV